MSERFYDREISKDLMRLAKLCEAKGISFIAQVEYRPGDTAEVVTMPKNAGPKSRLPFYAVKAHGNVDTLIMALMRDGEKNEHQSACLKILGVEPSQANTGAKILYETDTH
jgi:hypothetical protein